VGGILDLGDVSYQVDLNFMCFGSIDGAVVVEGSLDGEGFNPIGEFAATPAGSSLLGGGIIEFSPMHTLDKIRYVRLSVQGTAGPGLLVTVGGSKGSSGGTGQVGTLSETYDEGSLSSDQTMVLDDAKGGEVIFDSSGSGYSGPGVYKTIRRDGDVGLEVFCDGSLVVGDEHNNILIGAPDLPASVSMDYTQHEPALNVVFGPDTHVIRGDSNTLVGTSLLSHGYRNTLVGHNLAIDAIQEGGGNDGSLLMGDQCYVKGSYCVVVGNSINSLSDNSANVLVGTNIDANVGGHNVGAGIGLQIDDYHGLLISPETGHIHAGASYAIVMGCGAEAGHEGGAEMFSGSGCLVLGKDAKSRGVQSMVFGVGTYTEESAKVLFDNIPSHVSSFTAFSSIDNGSDSDPEHPDTDTTMCPLFSFDESSIAVPSSTSLTLLVKTSGGVDYFFPVKLTAPEMYTGICYLYIVES
jgi:hypothetical protein